MNKNYTKTTLIRGTFLSPSMILKKNVFKDTFESF